MLTIFSINSFFIPVFNTEKRKANKIMYVATLTNKTFSKFISGQCVEAVILGTIICLIHILVLSVFHKIQK